MPQNKTSARHIWIEWREVQSYPHQNDEGHDARVFDIATPRRFYRVEASASGDQPRFALETGSRQDCEQLAHAIAKAISEGMLILAER